MKSHKYFIFSFAFIFVNASCSLRIGEPSLQLSTADFSVGCLNQLDKKIDNYLAGKLGSKQISDISSCIQTALRVFKNRVRGKKRGEFKPSELKKFIEEFLLQDQVINDELLTQLMRLKVRIIGGSENKLTRHDIERFIIFVDIVMKEAIVFQPYIQIFNEGGDSQSLSDREHLSRIESDLKKSINRISVFLKRFSQPYSFSDMESLIRELTFMFDRDHNNSQLRTKIELAVALKQFIVNGVNKWVVQPEEWEKLLIGYSYLISMSVNISLLGKNGSLVSPKSMETVLLIVKRLLKFLSASVTNHPNEVIQSDDFLVLANNLQSNDLLNEKLTKSSLQNILLIFFGKVFHVDTNRYGVIQLNSAQMKKIYELINPWILRQSLFNVTIQKEPSFSSSTILSLKKMRPFLSTKRFSSIDKKFIEYLLSLKPLYEDSAKVHLSRKIYESQPSKELSYKNLTLFNFYYLLADMIKAGYSENPSQPEGLTSDELNKFFVDFNPISQNMGWILKTQQQSLSEGEAEFLAANVLTPSAEGFNTDLSQAERTSPDEIVEYLSYAFSFGFTLNEVEKFLSNNCSTITDVYGFSQSLPGYEKECVKKNILSALNESGDNMPDFRSFLSTLSPLGKRELSEALLISAFESQEDYEDAKYLHKYNVKNIIILFYFVETIFNRYDLNKDFVLDNEETTNSFPTFEGYIHHIFTYLLCQPDKVDSSFDVYKYLLNEKEFVKIKGVSLVESFGNRMFFILKSTWETEIKDMTRADLTQVFSKSVKGFLKKKNLQTNPICLDEEVESPTVKEGGFSTIQQYRRSSPLNKDSPNF